MNLICEKCEKEFSPKDIEIQEEYLGAMITEKFYHCPNCNTKYLIGVFPNKFREKDREGNEAKRKGNTERALKNYTEMKVIADKYNKERG